WRSAVKHAHSRGLFARLTPAPPYPLTGIATGRTIYDDHTVRFCGAQSAPGGSVVHKATGSVSKVRVRLESVIAGIAGILATLTLISREWIEALTRWDPDHG